MMLNDFGAEVVSVIDRLPAREQALARDLLQYGPEVGRYIVADLERAGTTLYFAPGHYVLEGPAGRIYTLPEGAQFYFAPGAILRVADGVTLRILGTIRAGQQQIFGFTRSEALAFTMPGGPLERHPEVITWPLYPGAGRVVIDSTSMPLVRPEWWGASRFSSGAEVVGPDAALPGFDSSDALRAAIEAACTGRRGRPPIPIAIGGIYQCASTLEVVAPVDADGKTIPVCLVLRGADGLGVGGRRTPSIVRNPRRTPSVGPTVLLRLHEGVSFDFQDLYLQAAEGVDGCIEVVCARNEPFARRGLLRRITLEGGDEFQLHIVQAGGASQQITPRSELIRRRQVVLDNCSLQPVSAAQSRNLIRLDAPESFMLHVSSTALRTFELRATARDDGPEFERAQNHVNCHFTGASVLMDSVLSQENAMPRPSRVSPDLDQPDGQDILLCAPPAGSARPSTHFTAVQCESQSWWYLTRDSRAPRARNVVLVGVSHGNGNLGDPAILARARAWGFAGADSALGTPPSIVWRGSVGRCVLVGCRLNESVLLSDPATILDVGTVFMSISAGDARKLFLSSPAQMSQRYSATSGVAPARSYARVDLSDRFPEGFLTWDADVAHLVPVLQDGVP